MKQRQELICWDCKEQFSALLPKEAVSRFIAACPYCGTECVISLKDCPIKMAVFRQGTEERPITGELAGEYDLPEVMETTAKTEE